MNTEALFYSMPARAKETGTVQILAVRPDGRWAYCPVSEELFRLDPILAGGEWARLVTDAYNEPETP